MWHQVSLSLLISKFGISDLDIRNLRLVKAKKGIIIIFKTMLVGVRLFVRLL